MNSPIELGFDHRYIPGTGPAASLTLLLLHGTGGDGDSLLQLGDTLRQGSTLLSPTGPVLENGMPRFFRRLAEGVFDQDDLLRRTDDLAQFIRDAVAAYHLDPAKIVAVGFSNGANIAASLLLKHPGVLAGAVLFRPMVPFAPDPIVRGPKVPVFVANGLLDPIVPIDNADTLVQLLTSAGCDVTSYRAPHGHELTMSDVRAARSWIQQHFP